MEAACIKETFKLQDAVKQVSRIVSGCAVHHAHTAARNVLMTAGAPIVGSGIAYRADIENDRIIHHIPSDPTVSCSRPAAAITAYGRLGDMREIVCTRKLSDRSDNITRKMTARFPSPPVIFVVSVCSVLKSGSKQRTDPSPEYDPEPVVQMRLDA